MAERVAIRDDSRITSNFALGTVREDAQNGLAFKVRYAICKRWDVRNIFLSNRDLPNGFDRYARIERAETIILSARRKLENWAIMILPLDIGLAWVESQIKSALAISKHANVHDQALICNSRIPRQVEHDCHVVSIVCCIEASDIDQTRPQAIPKVLCVKRRQPVIFEIQRLSFSGRVRDVCRLVTAATTAAEGRLEEGKED